MGYEKEEQQGENKTTLIYGRYNTCPPACYKIRTGKRHQCSNLPWSAVIRGEGRGRQRGRDRRILTMIFNRARLLFMLQLIQQGGEE